MPLLSRIGSAAARGFGLFGISRILDPFFKYVTLLLHGDLPTSSGTTIQPFNFDASANKFSITINGDTKPNGYNPYQAGYYSNYFGGSGNYLSFADNAVWDFGSGDFTIECWAYVTAWASQYNVLVCQWNTSNAFIFRITSGLIGLYANIGGTQNYTATVTNTLNTWNHYAVTRSGSTLTFWKDGTSVGTASISGTINNATDSPTIAVLGDNNSTTVHTGYISNMRLTKGGAIYSSNFTPSTTPLTTTVSSGTVSVLTCQSNRFIDNSTNALTITSVGSPTVSQSQPFGPPSSAASYGSGYFDGTGDSLSLTSSSTALPTGTQDFSVEMYLYWQTQGGSYPQIIANPVTNGFQIYYDVGAGALSVGIFNVANVITYTISQASLSGLWTHIAITRSGNTFRLFVNGVLRSNGTNTISYAAVSTQYIGSDGSRPYTGYITDVRTVLGSIPTAYQTSSTTNGTSVFTPPTAPLTAVTNTQLLTLQSNTAANNNFFLDSSTNNFIITRNGNTTQGTFTPYGSNWGNYCGSSNNFYMNGEAGFAFGSSADFTIQFWFFANTISADVVFYDGRPTTTQGAYPTIYLNGSTKVVSYVTSSAERITGTTTISTGTWYNVVLSRVSGTTRLFVNGTSQGSWADTTAYTNPASRPNICVSGYAANGYLDGYISNLSVLNGTGYTTVTVPTTPLSANTTNQILLLAASNRFIDANTATTAKTVNITGSPTIQRFSPFSPSTAYSTSVIGGSGYFDGSGDYLTTPQNVAFNLGTAAFTVEAWIDLSALPSPSNAGIITLGNGAAGSGPQYCGWGLWVNTSGTITFERYDGSEVTRTTSNAITLNQWNHIVAVRDSSSNFAIFINGVRGYSAASATTSYNNVNSDLLYVGRTISGAGPTTNYLTGYIGDVRVVAGTAVYTATSSTLTVPTAPLTAVSGTALLLNTTNGGIYDNAMMNDLETVGSAQVSTTQVKFGTGSMYFNGSSYLYQIGTPNLVFGSGDFTIELWLNISGGVSGTQTIIGYGTTATIDNKYWSIEAYGSNLAFYGPPSATQYFVTTSQPWTSGWAHIAVCRSGANSRLFVNGTQQGSTYTSLTNFDSGGNLFIGTSAYSTSRYMPAGYIDDLRITKGYARYTANFTAPTAAFPNQ